jgi:protein MpaA
VISNIIRRGRLTSCLNILLSNFVATILWTFMVSCAFAQQPTTAIYGHSVQNRPLVAETFEDGPNSTLILASIHGNERNTRPLAEMLIAYLSANPDAYSGCTVTVVACVNPDGWAAGTRVNADKVDLNRNFPVGWHANVPGKLRRGTGPLSEPEAKALAGLIEKLKPQKIVSIHNPLHMMDAEGAKSIALAALISSYNHYPVPKAGVGYPTPGSFGQFTAQYGIATVTLELPRESVADAWAQNKEALLAAIKATL